MSAVRFFYKHAGYCYNPQTETKQQGRWRCARELAHAEAEAKRRGWSVVWENDPEGCSGCCCCEGTDDCEQREHDSVEGAFLINDSGHQLGPSLWRITDATPEYRRVVGAELMSEALHEEERRETANETRVFTQGG